MQHAGTRALRSARARLLRGVRDTRVLGPRRLEQLARLAAAARTAWRECYAFVAEPWPDGVVIALLVLTYAGLALYVLGYDYLRVHVY